MLDTTTLLTGIGRVLKDATIPELPAHYRGKVRDNYDLPDGRRVLIATDRLSAFDRNITELPFKGQVLTQTARFWFDYTSDLCPNHVLAYPDPNILVGNHLAILPIEVVVRDYLAGTTSTSIWSMYKHGRRELYGIRFPDGLRRNEKLPDTIITPTTKGMGADHDAPLAAAEILSRGLMSEALWQQVSATALALFARGRDHAASRGLILVDTKYEFGLDAEGRLILADEIHTPDSSRYWFRETYDARLAAGESPDSFDPDSFDKDVVRRWVVARCDPYRDELPPIPPEVIVTAAQAYITASETITGETFVPAEPERPVLDRIRDNLRRYLGGW